MEAIVTWTTDLARNVPRWHTHLTNLAAEAIELAQQLRRLQAQGNLAEAEKLLSNFCKRSEFKLCELKQTEVT